jgi:hypothetical protein
MNDMIRDIEFLQEVIIAFTEGASDEKRMMVQMIENRIAKMQGEVDLFEMEAENAA